VTRARGERHGRAKLTADQIEELRGLRAIGATKYGLAKRYRISRRQVGRILNLDHWGHV
jgi:hypothetical protein